MKEDGKTVEQQPNWWERNAQRLRNTGIFVLGLGFILGTSAAVLLGGTGAVSGELVYSSERDLRKSMAKKNEDNK